MPAVSEKQRRFLGAEYSRLKKGEQTKTNLSEDVIKEFLRRKGKSNGR